MIPLGMLPPKARAGQTLVCVFFAACASVPVEPARERPRIYAVADVAGAGSQSGAIAGWVVDRLARSGLRAVSLPKTDPVLAGAAATLRTHSDSRLLQEIRRTTGADAVLLLELARDRSSISVVVLDARSGRVLGRETRRSGGERFRTVGDAATAVAAFVAGSGTAAPRAWAAPERGAEWEAETFGLGVNVLGGHLAWRPLRATRLELRYQTGRAGSGMGQTTSNVGGLRAYRVFREGGSTRPYLGVEGDYLDVRGSGRKAAGGAGGPFVGVERRVLGSLWFGVDAGPYLVHMRESSARVSETSLEFVANTALTWYLF
ncbi:MAG: hypothetical protein HY403_11120 [Elusimicrobia bacterium]|nr:hypothetical protein [Elusimicrobiota bacterium]